MLSYADVAGKTFSEYDMELKILSEDEATWTTSNYREESQTYLVNYEINSNEIKFLVYDTIRVNYAGTLFDTKGFTMQYYSDFFTGHFVDENVIEGTIMHNYKELMDGEFLIRSNSAEWDITLSAK